ncbi:MAG: DUF6786 family protein [Spirosomataceae bacterium]
MVRARGWAVFCLFSTREKFIFNDWQVPSVIDSEPFELITSAKSKIAFHKTASLTNYSGTKFDIVIERSVEILSKVAIEIALNLPLKGIKTVAYETTNQLTNQGMIGKRNRFTFYLDFRDV